MSSDLESLKKVKNAITSLKRGRQTLTISNIAKKAKIARKTIYNRPDLKLACDQAIQIQKQERLGVKPEDMNPRPVKNTSRYNLLQERYKKLQDENKEMQDKNEKLLFANRELALEKEQLKSKILMLEEKIERMNKNKVSKIK